MDGQSNSRRPQHLLLARKQAKETTHLKHVRDTQYPDQATHKSRRTLSQYQFHPTTSHCHLNGNIRGMGNRKSLLQYQQKQPKINRHSSHSITQFTEKKLLRPGKVKISTAYLYMTSQVFAGIGHLMMSLGIIRNRRKWMKSMARLLVAGTLALCAGCATSVKSTYSPVSPPIYTGYELHIGYT